MCADDGTRREAPGGLPAAIRASDPPPVLDGQHLEKSYQLGREQVRALRGVSLRLAAGSFLAVIGPSGAGKSTLLNLLGGLDRPDAGTVTIDGVDLWALSEGRRTLLRREKIGFVFQFFALIPGWTAYENLILPHIIAERSRRHTGRVDEIIERLHLQPLLKHRPGQLSAGEQQRVALGRALLTRPAILLADEPTGNLDYAAGQDILQLLWQSCQEENQTIILTTHSATAAAYADRVIAMRDGQIAETIELGRREQHDAWPLVQRLQGLGL